MPVQITRIKSVGGREVKRSTQLFRMGDSVEWRRRGSNMRTTVTGVSSNTVSVYTEHDRWFLSRALTGLRRSWHSQTVDTEPLGKIHFGEAINDLHLLHTARRGNTERTVHITYTEM